MSVKTPSLEKINERLIKAGKKLGGQISYKFIVEALHENQENITIEALDYIYDSLSQEGIELVDQLPIHSLKEIEKQKVNASLPRYRYEVAASSYEHRRFKQRLSTLNSTGPILCSEDALDWLLLKAEDQILSEKDLLTVIIRCRLSIVEIEQLLDYLTQNGIDIPKIDLSLFYFPEKAKLPVLHDNLLRYLSKKK